MRARADQKGKFRRTEENYKSESSTTIVTKSETITTVTNSFANTSVVTPKMDSQVVKNDETVDENSDRSGKMDRKEEVVAETVTVIEKKKRNKAKKERKEKKEKKEKKRDKTKSK